MANTYGFLRTASNNVGNTVEGVLGVEGSLTDMKKDLDGEYQRWKKKKVVLLAEQKKYNAEISRLKGALMAQKAMAQERDRIAGDVQTKKAENAKLAAANKEAEAKRALDRKGMEEDIDALKCATKTIQQAKQATVDAANQKTIVLKDQTRMLQEQVFKFNQQVNDQVVQATKQNVTNKNKRSVLLSEVEALQTSIHALEKQLVAQAQLEESVERARERLAAQTAETVKQKEKLTGAQGQCMQNKRQAVSDIEAARRALNDANMQMIQCQNMDAQNQKFQTELNTCLVKKRSQR